MSLSVSPTAAVGSIVSETMLGWRSHPAAGSARCTESLAVVTGVVARRA